MKTLTLTEGDAAEVLDLLLEAELDFENRMSYAETISEADHWRELASRCLHRRLAIGKALR
jgi:hypothetical protein